MEIHVIKPKERQNDKLRVCAYCRVSTEAEEQENSLENQKNHYERIISNNPDYEYVGVYYDFGLSGFKENRPGFQKMLEDVRNGKIDLIIVKSVSRFSRNTTLTIRTIRELKELNVGIFFELQNINTLTEEGELLLTVVSAFAQAESETYSQLAKMGIRRKYEKGEPIQHLESCFGYMKNAKGKYVKNPEEAKWVKRIYKLVAEGYSTAEVKRFINENGVKTVKGAEFSESTITRMIESEIYKGDYIMHKYYVNADRKLVKNKGQVDSWYITDDHPEIVSRKLWQEAQEALAKKREYLATGSIVGKNDKETYPYKNNLFCYECGYPLYRRVYSNGNRVCWGCSGKKRFNSKFCEGINIPDSTVREWKVDNENIYIRKLIDKLGKCEFKYVKEKTWKQKKCKKEIRKIPDLTEENYPYMKKIYCRECGSRLVRCVNANGSITWICNGAKRKGISYCKGVRVPDSIIKNWNIENEIYIKGKDEKNGKTNYSYSCKTSKDK